MDSIQFIKTMKGKDFIKKLFFGGWPYFIIFIVSAAFIASYWKKGLILAVGETHLFINPKLINYFYLWQDKINLGSLAYDQARVVLFKYLNDLIALLSFGAVNSSIIFVFLSFFLPAVFFYLCVNSLTNNKFPYLALPGSLLYSYNIFRALGPMNECQNLLFISLPLFFFFYFKLLSTKKWLYVFCIVIVSILSSSMAGNVAVFFVPFFLLGLYFIFFLFYSRFKLEKIAIAQNIILFALLLFANLFWFFPQILFYGNILNTKAYTAGFFTTDEGTFFDNFRLLGSWAWRAGHFGQLYYPFSANFYKPLLIFSTYFISGFSFIYLMKKKKNYLEFFILASMVVFFIFLSGTREPLGFLYKILFDHIFILKIYRSPYAKFTPALIFSLAFALFFSLNFLKAKITKKPIFFLIWLVVLILVIANAYPFFNKEAMRERDWSGGPRGYFVKIPDYWKTAAKYIEYNFKGERFATSPHNSYAGIYNWEYGGNFVGNAVDYLVARNSVRSWDIDNSLSGKVVALLLNFKDPSLNLQKNLGFLGAKYLLQENDLEWRYSSGAIDPPSVSNQIIKKNNLVELARFGRFTPSYLKNILNEEEDKTIKNQLNEELTNQPALILYKTSDTYFLPHFYIPSKIIISDKDISALPALINSDSYQPKTAIFFKYQNLPVLTDLVKTIKPYESGEITVTKINPTKYSLLIKNVKEPFVLVFNESFNGNWTIQPQSDVNHLVANGFANSWIVNPEKICPSSRCLKNSIKRFDLTLTVDFKLQKYLDYAFYLSAFIFTASLAVILVILKRRS